MIVLSSSERALSDIAIKAGSRRLGGEEVRLIDVPASEPGSQGVFDGRIETAGASTPLQATKTLVDTIGCGGDQISGPCVYRVLRQINQSQDWEAKARAYKTQFEAEVKAPNSTAVYRIRSNFAVIWAGGALAIDYGVLPWKKSRLRKAVEKCFRRALSALQNPETGKPPELDQHTAADVLQTLKEKLRQCELCAITPRKKVSDEEVASRKRADGFVIDGMTYLKQDRLKAWFPNESARRSLRQTSIFLTNRSDTPTVEKKVTGIEGKPRYYAIKANALDVFG